MKVTRQETAYNYLRKAILQHELAPGSALVEQTISNKLEISRTPVREAMKLLEAEGMISSHPVRGYYVAELNNGDLKEIFDLRVALELLALRTAIDKITGEEIAVTEKIFRDLNDNCSPEQFYNADRHLHDLITHNSGNRRLVRFLENLNSQIERFRSIAAMKPDRLKYSRQEHTEILQMIKEHDLGKAEKALETHINNVRESVISVCEKYMFY
ncbi:GntR family transcriptional regulator [Treponema primitia]|uniref:GntR family transcriptional regulator n=1 Tax=Treponema primitia TaxID=88058 RepID=UPI003980932F